MPSDFLSVVAEINRQERELDEVKKSLKLHFGKKIVIKDGLIFMSKVVKC